jgi:hypothetical protein
MRSLAVVADIPYSHFQAAWYFSIVLFAMLVLMLMGGGWAFIGVSRVWRSGDRAAASVIGVATMVALLFFIGAFIAGIAGLINTSGQG